MQIEDSILKSEERVIMELRKIYRMYGYACFKMNKFEEYDLYSQNKEFLVSDSVITFNDTNGKLMALKPDVTLSIVKNYNEAKESVKRLYYNENVYRVSEKTHNYKESMQMGIECIGAVTEYQVLEVVTLAVQSLEQISKRGVLNISNLDILSILFEQIENRQCRSELLTCIGEKNTHGIQAICKNYNVEEETAQVLAALPTAYGKATDVVQKIQALTSDVRIREALHRLQRIEEQVHATANVQVRVDLSLTNDMNYYNGLIFQGFVEGISGKVLVGGQYDQLMQKMGKQAEAIGFAVYLDLLERLKINAAYDVDVLLLYKKEDDVCALQQKVEQLIAQGKSVSVQMRIPEKLSYHTIEYFGGDK